MVEKKLALITGTSKGLGYHAALQFCDNGWVVYGFSRSASSISHPHYTHIPMDLSDTEDAIRYFESEFLKIVEPGAWDELVLINNAGQLGPIERMEELSAVEFTQCLQLNLVLPTWLMGFCYKNWRNKRLTVVNISSGAATKAYAGWSTYCCSKASLRMAGQVFWQEVSEGDDVDVRVFSYAPGVLDTQMQSLIRASDPKVFTQRSKFDKLYEENQLVNPSLPAAEILSLVNDSKIPSGIYEMRYGGERLAQSATS